MLQPYRTRRLTSEMKLSNANHFYLSKLQKQPYHYPLTLSKLLIVHMRTSGELCFPAATLSLGIIMIVAT